MAKKVAVTKSNKAVQEYEPEVQDLAKRYAGMGVNTSASENLVPMLRVLQGLSPQVLKKNEAYVQGAEAGDILLKDAPEPLVKGDKGFLFQPCYYSFDWVKWRPRKSGGGFLGRYASSEDRPPPNAKQVEDENGRMVWQDAEGNDWIFTRYFSGYVLGRSVPMPFVIPFSSTGHTVARTWNFAINNTVFPDTDPPVKASIFAGVWLIKTRHRSNTEGDWYVLDPQLHKMYDLKKDAADLDRGFRLHNSFSSKELRPEDPEMETQTEGM
jgi:hypothetical protein